MIAASDGTACAGRLEEVLALERRLGVEAGELGLELVDVLELAIDGGEADVGDAVELLQSAQGQLPQPLGVRRAAFGPQLGDDPIDERLELVSLDRALDRRPLEPCEQLRSIERLA